MALSVLTHQYGMSLHLPRSSLFISLKLMCLCMCVCVCESVVYAHVCAQRLVEDVRGPALLVSSIPLSQGLY